MTDLEFTEIERKELFYKILYYLSALGVILLIANILHEFSWIIFGRINFYYYKYPLYYQADYGFILYSAFVSISVSICIILVLLVVMRKLREKANMKGLLEEIKEFF